MSPELRIIASSLIADAASQHGAAAEALRTALEETGCFILRIEGAGPAVRAATQRWQHFYEQPVAIKQACQAERDEGGGWLRLRDEPVYMSHMSPEEREAERCKEQFGCGAEQGRWPDEESCPGFRHDVTLCGELLRRSAQSLLGSFEALLEQEPGFLRYEPGYLALTRHPASARASARERTLQLGLGEHSDAVVFTMLRQTAAALQVKTVRGDWLSVPVLDDDSFLVIPGDWMELFTNGWIPAVRHRVIELGEDREAIAFFQNVASMPVGPLECFLRGEAQSRYPTVDSTIPYAGGDSGVPRWQAHASLDPASRGAE